MKSLLSAALGCLMMHGASVEHTHAAQRPNILMICVDDLRPELRCYGVPYIHSPHIDQLASRGRLFQSHYVQAPTCGASRFTLLTGCYGGSGNQALFQRAANLQENPKAYPPSLPAWFRMHGYHTVSIGKVSHHPGGRGGADWDQSDQLEMPHAWDQHLLPAGPWQHPRGWMHGLAHGEIRIQAKDMAVFQSEEGEDAIYPDGPSIDQSVAMLTTLGQAAATPFFMAVGILRPHLPFGAPAAYMSPYQDLELPPVPHPEKPAGRTTWHGSGEFMKYQRWGRDPNQDAAFAQEVRRHYAACVSFADAQVGRLLKALETAGLKDNTVVLLWGDHGWHLGEHGIWGKHALFEESLRSPLIIAYPGMGRRGEATASMVESLDIFPTLCELAGLPIPAGLDGQSLLPILEDPQIPGHPSYAYTAQARTLRTSSHRLILHRDGFVELYDHQQPDGETQNVAAQHMDRVAMLTRALNDRLGSW